MDKDALQALKDATDALRRAEVLLNGVDRPALVSLQKALRAVDQLAQDHSQATLDLRIARLRIQALLGLDDPDKTPVDHHRPSASLRLGKLPPNE